MTLKDAVSSNSKFLHVALTLFFLQCSGSVTTAVVSAQDLAQNPSAQQVSKPQIVDKLDENQLVTLRGNTVPQARAQFDRGPVARDLPMNDIVLVLKRSPEQQAAFDKFVASQYDSSSPNFHHWLEPQHVGEKFGPAPSDIETITNWLLNHHFTIGQISPDHMTIRFSGSASLVESAFHTEIHNLEVKGEKHIANMSDPKIPAALAPAVVGIQSLHNFFARPLHKVGSFVERNDDGGGWKRTATGPESKPGRATKTNSQGTRPEFGSIGGTSPNTYAIEDVSPYDFATIYNVLPLWNASTPTDGSGQKIAIAGRSDINLGDVASFRSNFGLPVEGSSFPNYHPPTVIHPNTPPGTCATILDSNTTCTNVGDQIENTLDVEWSGAVAKNAQIVLVASSSTTSTDGSYISEQYIVSNKTATILSASYGACELILGTAGNTAYNNLWQSAASEGIAVFIATGDSGAPSCDQGLDTQLPYAAEYGLSVSGVASTPYNTAVGGTDFNWLSNQSRYWSSTNAANGSSALGYIPEIPWNDSCTNPTSNSFLRNYIDSTYGYNGDNAEIICNLIVNDNNLYTLVDVDGAGGGKSSCTTNSTTDSSTQIFPSSCSGGYDKPSWQSGVNGVPADGKRDIPDVSFFASNGFLSSSYLICITDAGTGCTYSSTSEPGYLLEVGGTSVATPAMAGVMALINQSAGAPQGNPNTQLYKLATQQTYTSCSAETVNNSSSCYFNDIDGGTISMPCDAGAFGYNSPDCTANQNFEGVQDTIGTLNGYNATIGYDVTSGLGSLNVANVVKGFAAAVAPAVGLSPTSLTFTSNAIGSAPAPQTITLKNTGTDPLSISSITVTGTNASEFTETNNCPASLASGSTCTISVTFTAAASGSLTGSISIADNAPDSPQTVSLAGSVVLPTATVSPASLSFTSNAVGTAPAAQNITLKNTSSVPLSISGISVTGTNSVTETNASEFTETNTCSTSLAAGTTCTISVTFTAAATGSFTGSISVADNAANSPQTVALSGSVVQPTFTLTTPALTVTPGTAGSETVTVNPAGGYSGTVNLTCSVSTLAGGIDTPTCAGGSATVTSSGGTGTLTINTTAPSSSFRKAVKIAANSGKSTGRPNSGKPGTAKTVAALSGIGVIAMAGLLFFGIPARKTKWSSMLALILALAGLGILSGCGGGSGSGGSKGGTTAGTYTVTVTGTDSTTSTITATQTFTLTVN